MWRGVVTAAVIANAGCAAEASLEVHVVEAETGAAIPGLMVDVGCASGELRYTDEQGRVRVPVHPGACTVSLPAFDSTTDESRRVDIRAHHKAVVELQVDRSSRARAQEVDPPPRCPHSAPGAVIRGHTLPQHLLDEIAHDVLVDWLENPSLIVDSQPRPTVLVGSELLSNGRQLGDAAVPRTSRTHFYAFTHDQLQAIADRAHSHITYVQFDDIESDGTCALVEVGTGMIGPQDDDDIHTCCCVDADLYEKRGARWQWVSTTAGGYCI